MRKLCSILIFMLLLNSCNLSFHNRISKIKEDPEQYQGKEVSIKGEVVETISIPFIQNGLYQVDDGTGKIWVMSQKRVPYRGDKVSVKGIVRIGLTVLDKNYGTVIVEQEENES